MNIPSVNCDLCPCSVEETQMHLLLECQFTQECWHALQIQVTNGEPLQILLDFQAQLNSPFSMDIIIIVVVHLDGTK